MSDYFVSRTAILLTNYTRYPFLVSKVVLNGGPPTPADWAAVRAHNRWRSTAVIKFLDAQGQEIDQNFVNSAIRQRMIDGNVDIEGPFTNQVLTDLLNRLGVPQNYASIGVGGGYSGNTLKNMKNRFHSCQDAIKHVINRHREQQAIQQQQQGAVAQAVAQAVAAVPPPPAAAITRDDVFDFLDQHATDNERFEIFNSIYGQGINFNFIFNI